MFLFVVSFWKNFCLVNVLNQFQRNIIEREKFLIQREANKYRIEIQKKLVMVSFSSKQNVEKSLISSNVVRDENFNVWPLASRQSLRKIRKTKNKQEKEEEVESGGKDVEEGEKERKICVIILSASF